MGGTSEARGWEERRGHKQPPPTAAVPFSGSSSCEQGLCTVSLGDLLFVPAALGDVSFPPSANFWTITPLCLGFWFLHLLCGQFPVFSSLYLNNWSAFGFPGWTLEVRANIIFNPPATRWDGY